MPELGDGFDAVEDLFLEQIVELAVQMQEVGGGDVFLGFDFGQIERGMHRQVDIMTPRTNRSSIR